jgi:hypothetical protein
MPATNQTRAASTATPPACPDPKRRAIELYQTTNLACAAIARQVGVSRETVHRWLQAEGITVVRRNGTRPVTIPPSDEASRLTDAIAEVHRDLAIIMGRLEGLVDALNELKRAAA